MIDEKAIPPRQRRRIRLALYATGLILLTYYLFFTGGGGPPKAEHGIPGWPAGGSPHAGPHPPELLDNLSLTTAQCEAAFPNLTWPVRDAVSQGAFTLSPQTAPVLARIRDGQLATILKAQRRRALSPEMLASRAAALHQVHRALLTAPEPPPGDTVFALNFQDQPFGSAWGYARQADPRSRPGYDDGDRHARTFLMPHFAFWAWKLPFVGSVRRAAAAVEEIEGRGADFASKIPRAVWRGTAWFNSVQNPRLRQDLLRAAKGRPWADVEALKWDTKPGANGEKTASNSLAIEDFCRYKYVLYTEGVTYSGRFQFLQMCGSVLLSPPIAWMMHTTHLVKPVFSSDLPGLEGRWTASEMTKRAWPVRYAAEEANMVFVKPDWSDLEDTIKWLEDHPKTAEGIARRQRDTFVGGGYFSPAAEACYWRALVRGWAEVARWDEAALEDLGEGQTYEAFVLTNGD